MISTTRDISTRPGISGRQPIPAKIAAGSFVELENPRLEALRKKIDNEDYLHEAIQRIALILSNELLDIPQGGLNYERQRKGRR